MSSRPVVIVPLEASRDMRRTIASAVAVARGIGGTVDLLEIVPARRPSYVPDRTGTGRTSASAKRGSAGSTRTVKEAGKPLDVIPSYAQVAGAALIVVDRHYGTSRLRRSTRAVTQLARSAPVPVLVLPARFRTTKRALTFQRIVAAADFTVASAVALRTVADMARKTKASLTLVHSLSASRQGLVFSGSEQLEHTRRLDSEAERVAEMLRNQLAPECRFEVDTRVETADVDRAILAVADDVDADLIVMGVPPRTDVDMTLFGSKLRSVLRKATVPVLVLSVRDGAQPWPAE